MLDFIGGQGEYGRESKVNPTLRTAGQGAIAYGAGLDNSQITNALIARMSSAVGTTQDNLIVTDYRDAENYIVRRLTPTECARLQGFPDTWGHPDPKDTFTEEELRFWTDVRNTFAAINDRKVKDYTEKQMLAWYNKLHTDSAEYKMWGNGIALPTALYVMQGIEDALNEERTDQWPKRNPSTPTPSCK